MAALRQSKFPVGNFRISVSGLHNQKPARSLAKVAIGSRISFLRSKSFGEGRQFSIVGQFASSFVEGNIYLVMGPIEKVGVLVMWIVPPGEDTASYWLKLGIALFNGGQYEEASKAFDRSIELDPKDTETWNNRGIALSILKRNKEAIQSFEKATSIDPRNAEAWYNRGMVLCSQEQYEDAVDSLEKALEIDPQSAIVWHNKGVALKHLGRDTEARLAFACAGRLGTS